MPYEKRPVEVKDFKFDWARHLLVGGVDVGDIISTSTWTVETGITKDSETNTTSTATVWLSGGTEGVHYTVTNRVVTAQGRTYERSIVVQVKVAPV